MVRKEFIVPETQRLSNGELLVNALAFRRGECDALAE
jgi:hypothetical protein